MDSLTQIILGAATGEAVLGKKVGNKALLWGAVAGTIPDLDVLPGMIMDTVPKMEIHRGFSHSILFDLIFAPIFGWLLWQIYKKKEIGSFKGWTLLMFWGLFTHPLLDAFTTWGTQLFWPFEWRVAIHSIFVVDPLYTVPFMLCVIAVLFIRRDNKWRSRINWLGIGLSSFYLASTLVNKAVVDGVFEGAMERKSIEWQNYSTRPTPLNTVLWTVNAETEDGFHLAYYSHLDPDHDPPFLYIPKQHELLAPIAERDLIQRLLFLTQGYYVVEKEGEDWWVHDLRFGLMTGFKPDEPGQFVFSYHIHEEDDGSLSIINPEPEVDNPKLAASALWRRIQGEQELRD